MDFPETIKQVRGHMIKTRAVLEAGGTEQFARSLAKTDQIIMICDKILEEIEQGKKIDEEFVEKVKDLIKEMEAR